MGKYVPKRIVFEARQVKRRERVVTPHGSRNAFPGTWVVTDDFGQDWPVPPEEFNHFFKKAPADNE